MDINIALKLAICNLMTVTNGESLDLHKVKTTLSSSFTDFIDVKEFIVDHISGFLIRFESYNVLVFKQTDDIHDWLHNIDTRTTKGFHRGFYEAADDVFATTLQLTNGVKFYLTGHSLGGAISTVLTYWLADKPNFISTYTFGSPKVVTNRLRPLYEEKTKGKLIRFRKHQDIVTFLPSFPAYTHVGEAFYISKHGDILPHITPSFWELYSLKFKEIYLKHHISGYISALKKAQ